MYFQPFEVIILRFSGFRQCPRSALAVADHIFQWRAVVGSEPFVFVVRPQVSGHFHFAGRIKFAQPDLVAHGGRENELVQRSRVGACEGLEFKLVGIALYEAQSQ